MGLLTTDAYLSDEEVIALRRRKRDLEIKRLTQSRSYKEIVRLLNRQDYLRMQRRSPLNAAALALLAD